MNEQERGDVFQQLMARLMPGGMPQQQQGPDLESLRKFLLSAPGRNAMRGAVERVVTYNKLQMRDPAKPLHMELIEILDYARMQSQPQQMTPVQPMSLEMGTTDG